MTWRIGLLIPSSNTVMEVDFYRHLPRDATLHTGRMYMTDTTVEGESRMLDEFTMPAAESVATAFPHVTVFGCTSAGALRGQAYDRELCARIAETTNGIAVSVIESVNQALKATRASSVVIVTPYVDELNERIQKSVEAEGMAVSGLHGMGISNNFDIASVTPDEIVEYVRQKCGSRIGADALFLSCTNFNALSALSTLKMIYDSPIVTSNQAALQSVLRHIDDLRQDVIASPGSITR